MKIFDAIKKSQIKGFMFNHWEEHLDDANCLNMTTLAEDTASEFGDNRHDEDIPEEYFELSLEVSKELKKESRINS